MKSTPTTISTSLPESGKAIPKHRGWTVDLLALKPGESFLAKGNNASIRSTCCYVARVHREYKFLTRREGVDTRVWRLMV
jgi:hypothetical protein